MRPGAGTREERNNEPIIILEAEQPPILVHPSHLGGVLSAGQVFNIGVRLKTKQVNFKNDLLTNNYFIISFFRDFIRRLVTLKFLKFNLMHFQQQVLAPQAEHGISSFHYLQSLLWAEL